MVLLLSYDLIWSVHFAKICCVRSHRVVGKEAQCSRMQSIRQNDVSNHLSEFPSVQPSVHRCIHLWDEYMKRNITTLFLNGTRFPTVSDSATAALSIPFHRSLFTSPIISSLLSLILSFLFSSFFELLDRERCVHSRSPSLFIFTFIAILAVVYLE